MVFKMSGTGAVSCKNSDASRDLTINTKIGKENKYTGPFIG
jgi:hypothetical protein